MTANENASTCARGPGNETVAALAMVDDRNLTSDTYNEQLAVAIFGALPKYAELLGLWLERMQRGVGEG